jgi:signal peptidase II
MESTSRFQRPSVLSLICFAGTAAIGFALDQWTKLLAVRHLANPPRTYEFITGFLHFEFVKNPGAVFGLGQGNRWLFVFASVLAVVFLTYLFLTSGRRWMYQIILGMLLAGVLGNVYDRILLGYVRDMIHAFPRWGIFPYVFNVADSLLCVGVGLMILYSWVVGPSAAPRDDAPLESDADSSDRTV